MRIDKRIHAACVGLHAGTLFTGGDLNILLRGRAHAEDPLLAIKLDVSFAENLGEFTGSRPPDDVHLPQTVLRGYVALREEEVVKIRGFDGRNTVPVADNGYWSCKSGNAQLAVKLRQCRAGNPVEPSRGHADDDDEN